MSRDETLADAVLDVLVWFEFVDDQALDPDLAVKALEQIARNLHRLAGGDRDWFVGYVRARAATERDPRYRRAYEAVAEDLADA